MVRGIVEPTGTSVRHGMVQIRLSFYLEPGDARYGEHYVHVTEFPEPDAPLGGYPSELEPAIFMDMELKGSRLEADFVRTMVPVSGADYDAWVESLPKVWQVNPFHNHMERVSPDATDDEIADLLRGDLIKFYAAWAKGDKEWMEYLRTGAWKRKGRKGREKPGDMSPESIQRCELKGLDIAKRASAFEHRGRR